MDQYASVLLAFPDSTELTNEAYHQAAKRHVQKVEELVKHGAGFGDEAAQLLEVSAGIASASLLLFDTLTLRQHVDPAINSISYLALLMTLLQRDRAPQTNITLLTCITKFLMTFDARQIRYIGDSLSGLLAVVVEGNLFTVSDV